MFNPFDDNLDNDNTGEDRDDTGGINEYDMATEEVAERRVGSEPIPGFGYYVLTPKGATAAYAFDDKTRPILRHRLEVVEGPDGTIGKTCFIDQPMAVQRDKWTNEKDANGKPIRDPLSAEELAENIRKFQLMLNRIAQVFGFDLKAPKSKELAAIGLYGAQFEKAGEAGKTFIGEVKKNTKNGFTKNLMYFDSIAAIGGAPSPDYRGKAKTALDEAKEKIAAKNKALTAQGSRGGGARSNGAKPQTASAQGLD